MIRSLIMASVCIAGLVALVVNGAKERRDERRRARPRPRLATNVKVFRRNAA